MRGRPPKARSVPRNRLAELREARNWSQQDVAIRMGMTQRRVSYHERGVLRLNGHDIEGYARVFGVWPAELFADPTALQHPRLVAEREAALA